MAKSKHRTNHKEKVAEHQFKNLEHRIAGYREQLGVMQAAHAEMSAATDATLKELEAKMAEQGDQVEL